MSREPARGQAGPRARAGCSLLLSEDLNAGQTIRGVRVENPSTLEVEPAS